MGANLDVSDHSRQHILIVDDDVAFLRLLERHLRSAGHEVLATTQGAEALRLLLEHGPRIVITDWNMPGMSGLELCRTVRNSEVFGFVYLIILTADSNLNCLVDAFRAGADDFLTKPFHQQELLARLRAAERIVVLQSDLDHRAREVHLANAKLALTARELENANKRLRVLATTDDLTGLLNRREAIRRLDRCWQRALRHGAPLSVISLDIDHFKKINDTHGHAAGDMALREVCRQIVAVSRTTDDLCRIGGEEFLAICSNTTGVQAAELAERYRRTVEVQPLHYDGGALSVTISLGAAQAEAAMGTPDDLLRAADAALYAAKHAGRNCVRVADGGTVAAATG